MSRTITPLEESSLPTSPAEEATGFGALETAQGCLPLVAMDVRAKVVGLAADITVRQTFRNALDVPLEATYIFPLPDRAAVTSFRLKVADRVVEGVLKERAQARAEYQEAIEAGHRAAIAEEERSGTFNLRVGNIPPKETVSVELTLVGPLPVAGGEAEFRFPLVVAPRYVPGVPLDGPPVGMGTEPDTDQAPDASRVTPPVLLPGFPNPVQLSVEVELDPAGLDVSHDNWWGRVRSSLHAVVADDGPPWTVCLQPGERLNRDFLLRFPLCAAAVQTSLVASPAAGSEPGTFALSIVPPAMAAGARPAPRDVVFVLDRSGSMEGWKMVAARRAVGRMIDTLLEQDRFTVLAFDTEIEFPRNEGKLVEATNRQRWQALEWLGKIDSRGGTEMGPALREAAILLAKSGPERQRVVVLVTDGQVAGEDAVLKSFAKAAGKQVPRVHTLGIDQAVNAGFLRRLADRGGGVCELVESESQLDSAMDRIHRTIGQPVLTDLRIEPLEGNWPADTLVPSRLPDLFADRPVTIFGRLAEDATTLRVRISATDAAGSPWRQEIAARPVSTTAIRSLWGRARVRELEDLYASGTERDLPALAKKIVEVSLACQVLSRFTAYVAVDRSEVVNPEGKPLEVVQPVEMPQGWKMGVPVAACMVLPAAGRCMSSGAGILAKRRSRSGVSFHIGGAGGVPDADDEFLLKDGAVDLAREELCGPPEPSQAGPSPEGMIAAARLVIDEFERVKRHSARRRGMERLIRRLETILQACAGVHVAEEQAIREVLDKARELLQAAVGGDKDALSDEKVRELIDFARQTFDRFGTPSSPPRETFWT